MHIKTLLNHKTNFKGFVFQDPRFSSGIVEDFNNKAKLTIRKSYMVRSDKLRKINLYYTLGNLPAP